MKKSLLKICMGMLFSSLLFVNISAQGTYGNSLLFDFNNASASWTTATTGTFVESNVGTANQTVTVDGISTVDPTRSAKQGYSGATKCTSVTISEFSSLGQINLALQNGSTSKDALIKVQYSLDGTSFADAEEISLISNADVTWSPTNVIVKSALHIRFVFPFACWFYGVSAYDHVDEATGATAGPVLVSVNPAANSNLPATGPIVLQFDELLTLNFPAWPTIGNATMPGVSFKANTLVLGYSGFTDATNPLVIPANFLKDLAGTLIASEISIPYQLDNTPPIYQSASKVDGSSIHVSDLGETARIIYLTFDEPIVINKGEVSFNGATVEATASNNVLVISYTGLPYNTANTLIVPDSFIVDFSGNQLAADVNLTYNTGDRDAIAPVLSTQSVANLAIDQPISGSINFTFDEIVLPSTAVPTINGAPAYFSNNGNVIGLNYTNLANSAVINVVLPAGCLADTCGNAYAGTSFSFNTVGYTSASFDYVVAKDGSGDYTTIQEAIDASSGTSRTLIYVKKGIYQEKLTVSKNMISVIGEDVDKTIITWNECSSTATPSAGTDNSYTMLVSGADFYGENFTVRNDYDYINGTEADKQSVAMEHKGDMHVLKNCKFYSYQDTYYPKVANTRQYLTGCTIQGGTDFIFGGGTALIENSTIKCVKGGYHITAAADTQKEFGLVLKDCNFSYADTLGFGSTNQFDLGRPWKAPAKTTYVNGVFENNLIIAAGWTKWSSSPTNHLHAIYREYNSTADGGGALDISSRVDWSSQLTTTEASRVNVDNVFNYGASGSWNPSAYPIAPVAPTNVAVSAVDGTITFTPSASSFAVGYLVYRNDTLIGNTVNPVFTATPLPKVTDDFRISAYNKYGALSFRSASLLASNKETKIKSGFLVSTLISNNIELLNPNQFSSVELISVSGNSIFKKEVDSASISIESLQAGCFLVKGMAKNGDVYVDKIIKK